MIIPYFGCFYFIIIFIQSISRAGQEIKTPASRTYPAMSVSLLLAIPSAQT
jgi:hypothetical protein